MSKSQLVSSSLVAAIPGGFLLYLMLMAVLNNLSTMPTMLKAASITLLVMAGVLVIFPLYLLVFFGRAAAVAGPAPAKKTDAKKGKAEETAAQTSKKNAPEPAFVADDDVEDAPFTLDDESDLADGGQGTELFDLSGEDSGDADMFDANDEEFEFEEFPDDDDDVKPKKR